MSRLCETTAMNDLPAASGQHDNSPPPGTSRPGPLRRALKIIEFVAAHGGSNARTIADGTALPLPTVYRLLSELCEEEILVHLKNEKTFALGYRLHEFAVRLHDDLGLAPEIRREITNLHDRLGMASYLALHRGTDFVVVFVADSPRTPRLQPMGFGFRDNPHASAFGKLGLATMEVEDRRALLEHVGMTALTPRTITSLDDLEAELETIADAQIAWESEEFSTGIACAAAPLFAEDGRLLGSVAVSAPVARYSGQRTHVEHVLRSVAARVGRFYRLGPQFHHGMRA